MIKNNKKSVKVVKGKGQGLGGLYFLTMIASAIYFIQTTNGFWNVILALLKAVVWPVFVAHRALVLLKV